jgi:hypothetical protein
MGLECKKKYVPDLGELTADYVFTIPLKSRAVALSVGKCFPAYREMQFPAALHKACFENVCDVGFRLRRRPAIMCN